MYEYFRNTIQQYFTGSLTIILILSSSIVFPQIKTNIEIFYSLTDSLVNDVASGLNEDNKNITLTLNLGDSYSVFSNSIRNGLQKKGIKIFPVSSESKILPEINLNLINAKVEYGESERDGWFGNYYVSRTIAIEGNYLNSLSGDGLISYYFKSVDSVNVDEIESLESESFPFTKGKVPGEPFFSSLWEPVIAIGVAAVTVILFFSVRSK